MLCCVFAVSSVESKPPQTYELHNAGEKAVSYEVDITPLHTLTQSNYLMPILQCLQSQGEVPPHGTAAVPFIFSPLEAKRYSVSPYAFTTHVYYLTLNLNIIIYACKIYMYVHVLFLSNEAQLLWLQTATWASMLKMKVTQCIGCISANTRLHQLCWSDWKWAHYTRNTDDWP